MKNTKKKGFTIVELVIVIAVIAVLAAVLIPTFTGVVKSANVSAAMQTARIAWANYIAEAEGGQIPQDGRIVVNSNGGPYNFYMVSGTLQEEAPADVEYETEDLYTTEGLDAVEEVAINSVKLLPSSGDDE